jgi:hypothetical protein
LVWFRLNGLGSSQTTKIVSFTTGALVGVGSLKPFQLNVFSGSPSFSLFDMLLVTGMGLGT